MDLNELLELSTAQSEGRVFMTNRYCDIDLKTLRQYLLGFLNFSQEITDAFGFLSWLQFVNVDVVLMFELLKTVFEDLVVEVFSSQMRIAVGSDHLTDAISCVDDRDVERAAAEIEHKCLLRLSHTFC